MREFTESGYYLSDDFVNQFKDEVIGSAGDPDQQTEADDTLDDREDGESDDRGQDHCTSNWKAATRDQDKKMWGIFYNSGIFASACRHGFILWIADMVKSGEL